MRRVVVINHLTLDGVMQSPGRADEDTRDGFALGGWAGPNVYEDMLGYWNTQDSPFKDMLNDVPKYIASRTLSEPLPWPNSTLLTGDHHLIDEYLLLVHPLVLGTGRRLFPGGGPPVSLRRVDSTVSTTGVLIATYQPSEASP